jgi:O-antigen/teichoic acid export membrane protein
MRVVIGLSLIITIVILGLGWALLPQMGIVGVGVAWLASQSAVALVVVFRWVQQSKRRPPDSIPT